MGESKRRKALGLPPGTDKAVALDRVAAPDKAVALDKAITIDKILEARTRLDAGEESGSIPQVLRPPMGRPFECSGTMYIFDLNGTLYRIGPKRGRSGLSKTGRVKRSGKR